MFIYGMYLMNNGLLNFLYYCRNKIQNAFLQNAFPTFPIIFNLVEIWSSPLKFYCIKFTVQGCSNNLKKIMWTVFLRYFKFLETVEGFRDRLERNNEPLRDNHPGTIFHGFFSPGGNLPSGICWGPIFRVSIFQGEIFRGKITFGAISVWAIFRGEIYRWAIFRVVIFQKGICCGQSYGG